MELRNRVVEGGWYVAYHWAVIFATPLLLLGVNPNLFVNPNTNVWIDPWVYTGFFLSLPDHLIRWGNTYYATRLSWLLPGYAAHQIFSPDLANYVIHFAFFYFLLASVYWLITAAANRTTAFIATLLVAWNPQVIAAQSWDYVDGAVMTYFAAALLCLEKASSSATYRAPWAIAAGVALACMAAANLVSLTLVPICCLFLLLRMSVERWRDARDVLLVAAVGAAATLAILGLANWQLGGRWLFLWPSVVFAGRQMWIPSPWDVQGISWLAHAHTLLIPAVASVGSLLALSRRPWNVQSFAGTVQLTFLVAVAWWLIHSALWTHSIHLSYYMSYLVPLGLITLVLMPDSPLATLASPRDRVVSPRDRVVAIELATLGLLITAHALVFRGDFPWEAASSALVAVFPDAHRFNAITAFAVCSVALVLVRFVRSQWFRWPAFLLTLWIAYGSMPMNFETVATSHLKEDFAVTVSAHRYIGNLLDNNRRLAMWYALADGEQRPFKNIASTYLWGWMLVNEKLPSLDEPQAAKLMPDTQLVLLVADLGETELARRTLQTFDFDYTPRAQEQFGRADASFWVVIGDLSRLEKADP